MELKTLLRCQLSETEAIIYLLLNSNEIGQRELARALGYSHTHIGKLYEVASDKIAQMDDANLFTKKD